MCERIYFSLSSLLQKYGVKIKYADTIYGRQAKKLVESGKLNCLSLAHTVMTDTGQVIPEEVSLCIRGKREGTEILRDANGSSRMVSVRCSGTDRSARALLFDEFKNIQGMIYYHNVNRSCY